MTSEMFFQSKEEEKKQEQQLLADINKTHVYVNSLNYLISLRESAEYYLKTAKELKKERPNDIRLLAAETNAKSAIANVQKVIKELNESSEKLSVYEIKEFILNNSNSKNAYILNLETKKLLDDFLKEYPVAFATKEIMRTATESLPLVGGAVGISGAVLDYQNAIEANNEASLARINLYIVASLTLLPGGIFIARHAIKETKKAIAIEKLLGLKPSPEIIKKTEEIIQGIPATVSSDLAAVRKSLLFKNESIFVSLENIDTSLNEVISRHSSLKEILTDAKVYVLDKSGTWLLNGLDYKVGDLGLLIYFRAMKKLEEKGVYIARMTEKGDEIVILGKRGFEDEIKKALIESSEEIFKRYGIKDTLGLKEKCAKISILSKDIIVLKDGRIMYRSGTKEIPFNLDKLINDVELEHSLRDLTKSERKAVTDFLDSLEKIKLMKKGTDETIISSSQNIKVVYEIEDPKLARILQKVAESNNKAILQASTNTVGPSLANQLGHVNADKMTAAAIEALVLEGVITKKEAEAIFQTAALTCSIKSPEIAKNLSRLNGFELRTMIGNTKVKLKFFVGTPAAIEKEVTTTMLTKMGIRKEVINEVLPRINDINKTIAKLHLEREEIAPWARDTLSMLQYIMSY